MVHKCVGYFRVLQTSSAMSAWAAPGWNASRVHSYCTRFSHAGAAVQGPGSKPHCIVPPLCDHNNRTLGSCLQYVYIVGDTPCQQPIAAGHMTQLTHPGQ